MRKIQQAWACAITHTNLPHICMSTCLRADVVISLCPRTPLTSSGFFCRALTRMYRSWIGGIGWSSTVVSSKLSAKRCMQQYHRNILLQTVHLLMLFTHRAPAMLRNMMGWLERGPQQQAAGMEVLVTSRKLCAELCHPCKPHLGSIFECSVW